MSYLVLARKYRPEVFKDLLGQDHVVQTLSNAIAQQRLAHAYLFVGPRGTGKTTTARIFAKALNCKNGPSIEFSPDEDICKEIAEGRSLDVYEIDGASNNGVEQVRELRETVKFLPARCRYKIIYIDEVHMLSSAAFNALLKTLEEPPPHVKFIFATTEAHKILPTIISRCQRFDLRPLAPEVIAQHLQNIGEKEGVVVEEEAAWSIAKGADGGMRDALSMLDQLVAFCGTNIQSNHVREIFGFTSGETIHEILTAIFRKDNVATLKAIQAQHSLGKDLSQLLSELIQVMRSLLIVQVQPDAECTSLPSALWNDLKAVAGSYGSEQYLSLLDLMAEAAAKIRWAADKSLHLEIALIRAIQSLDEVSLNDLIKTLGRIPEDTPLRLTPPTIASVKTVAQKPELPEPAPKPELPESPFDSNPTLPRPKRPTRSTVKDISMSLDRLIENAPEELPEEESVRYQPPPKVAPKPEPSASPDRPKRSSVKDSLKKAQEDFYQDPLITEALRIFEGSLLEK